VRVNFLDLLVQRARIFEGTQMARDHGPNIKDDAQYAKLREEGANVTSCWPSARRRRRCDDALPQGEHKERMTRDFE